MLTAIAFIVVYVIGLLATLFRHPIYGLYTYMWAFYLSPPTVWWGNFLPSVRYLFLAAIATGVSILVTQRGKVRRENPQPWFRTPPGKAVVFGVIWICAQYLWAVNQQVHLTGIEVFLKHGIVFALVYTILSDTKAIERFAMVHVLGCAWLGYVALGASGGRLENLGGAVNNSNLLGSHTATAVLFAAMFIVGSKDSRRWIAILVVPFILNIIILTQSRGAFLALMCGGLAAYLLVPQSNRRLFMIAGSLGLVVFISLASNSFITRMDSLKEAILGTDVATASEDGQADRDKRLDIAKGGIRIALDYPLGAGYRGTGRLSSRYMPAHVLNSDGQRGAHNTFVGVLAEFGFPGAIVYLLLVLYAIRTLLYLKRLDQINLPVEYARSRAAIGSALVAVFVGGQFSNFYQAEVHFWLFAMLAALHQAAKQWEATANVQEIHNDSALPECRQTATQP